MRRASKILAAILTVGALVILVRILGFSSDTSSPHSGSLRAPDSEVAANMPASDISDEEELDSLPTDSTLRQPTNKEQLVGRTWEESHGYHYVDNYEDPFSGLNITFVEEQARAGDMTAQQHLGHRLTHTNYSDSLYWYQEATIQGSTFALINMADIYSLIAKGKIRASEEVASSAHIRAAEYALVALLRSDTLGGVPAIDRYKKMYEYSDEEFAAACTQSRLTYDSLEKLRRERGNSAFVNSDNPTSLFVNVSWSDYCGT